MRSGKKIKNRLKGFRCARTACALVVPAFMLFAAQAHDGFAQSDLELNARLKVSAGKGLNLRKDASEKTPVVALIPDGENVYVHYVTTRKVTVGGKQGHWVSVIWKDREGFAFSAFLQKDFPASFRFSSIYYAAMALMYAEKEQVEVEVSKDSNDLVIGKGVIGFVEPLPPVDEVRVTIAGFKKPPVLKEGYVTKIVFAIDSIKVASKGEGKSYIVQGRLVSLNEVKQ